MSQNQAITEILGRPELWVKYRELATSSLSPQLAAEALELGDQFLIAATNGTFIDPLPAWAQGLFLTVMQHVAYGTPAYFSDAMAAAWKSFTGTIAQCTADDYRAPSSVSKCPVCGADMIRVDPAQPVRRGIADGATLTNIPVA